MKTRKILISIALAPVCILSMLFVLALASGEKVYLDRPEGKLTCAHCGDAPLDIFNHMDVCEAHAEGNECKRCKK